MQWKEDNRGDFENFWKDAFQDEQMSPPEGLWDDIEAEVDQINQKKNHFTFLRSVAALITVGLLTSFLVKYETPHSLSIGSDFDGKNVNTASMVSPSLYEADAIKAVSVLDKHILPRIKKVAVNMPPPMPFLTHEEEKELPPIVITSYSIHYTKLYEGELLITGQVLLDLWNPFGTGKRFFIDWKRPDNDSQWFNATYEHPRLFRSTIDFAYNINIQQQDSTFLKVDNSIQIKKRVSTRASLSLGATWESSRILRELNENDVDTLNDTQSILYSIGYKWQNLDNPISPRRGWRYEIKFTGGQRNIIFNPALPSEVYDGIPQNSSLLQWQLETEYYFGITKWLEGYLKLKGAQMLGDNLFKNDRITSYNVCYTKLLRRSGFEED